MSGPKVVRIVSREEIEALCRAQIREVSRAAEALARVARRHDRLDAAMEADRARRTARFERMLADQQWMDIQKRARAEVAFLRGEATRLEAEAIERARAARIDARRVVDAARSIIGALEGSGVAIDADLRSVATGKSRDLDAARAIVETAIASLRMAALTTADSPASKALAGRLAAGTVGKSIDEWIASQPQRPDPAVARIDKALSELSTVLGAEAAKLFEARAAAIVDEQETGRRSLLADSLVLDAGATLAANRAATATRERLEAALEGLEAASAATSSDLRTAANGADTSALDVLATRAESALATHTAEQAAAARRRAVLSGLADLGYEVRQSMTTALAENGRVIVRKPSEADYGIELSAPAGAARIQIRLVGAATPSAPRSTARDRDKETSWCGDVGRLRAILTSAGSEFVIERALAVGAEPVKTVALEGLEPSGGTDEMPTAAGAGASRS